MILSNVTLVEIGGAFIHSQQLEKRVSQKNRTNNILSILRKGGMSVIINPGKGFM